MSKKLYEESNIEAIAIAIRNKKDTDDTYKVSEMASAISDINPSMPIAVYGGPLDPSDDFGNNGDIYLKASVSGGESGLGWGITAGNLCCSATSIGSVSSYSPTKTTDEPAIVVWKNSSAGNGRYRYPAVVSTVPTACAFKIGSTVYNYNYSCEIDGVTWYCNDSWSGMDYNVSTPYIINNSIPRLTSDNNVKSFLEKVGLYYYNINQSEVYDRYHINEVFVKTAENGWSNFYELGLGDLIQYCGFEITMVASTEDE